MISSSLLGQLSSVLWLVFFVCAFIRLVITVKDSQMFKTKN